MQRISSVLPVVSMQLADSHMMRCDFVNFASNRYRFFVYWVLLCSRI